MGGTAALRRERPQKAGRVFRIQGDLSRSCHPPPTHRERTRLPLHHVRFPERMFRRSFIVGRKEEGREKVKVRKGELGR